jgi:trigger factor
VDFAYTATFEVYPDVKLGGLDELRLKRPEPAFDEADTDFVIASLRRQRATWGSVDEPARDGDRVTVDFDGRIDGVPIEGGEGEGVIIVLGAGRMLADFERQLVGMRAGEARDINVGFPADYPTTRLAGKLADFHVRVTAVEQQRLPEVDTAFIQAFGVASGDRDEFHAELRQNMDQEFAARARADIKRQILDQLLAANPLDLPHILVEREATALQNEAMRNLGITDPNLGPSLESFRQTAERRVRLGLLIAAIIRDHDLVADRDKVRERIEQMSQGYDKPDEVRQLYYQNANLLQQVENLVLEEQVIDWLVARAAATAQATTFRALVER